MFYAQVVKTQLLRLSDFEVHHPFVLCDSIAPLTTAFVCSVVLDKHFRISPFRISPLSPNDLLKRTLYTMEFVWIHSNSVPSPQIASRLSVDPETSIFTPALGNLIKFAVTLEITIVRTGCVTTCYFYLHGFWSHSVIVSFICMEGANVVENFKVFGYFTFIFFVGGSWTDFPFVIQIGWIVRLNYTQGPSSLSWGVSVLPVRVFCQIRGVKKKQYKTFCAIIHSHSLASIP